MNDSIIKFVKSSRKAQKISQIELAALAGVGLRFVRDLEQGKPSLRLDKVNDVLVVFNAKVGVETIKE
jgi:y4mF family transcriptional regulator